MYLSMKPTIVFVTLDAYFMNHTTEHWITLDILFSLIFVFFLDHSMENSKLHFILLNCIGIFNKIAYCIHNLLHTLHTYKIIGSICRCSCSIECVKFHL